MALIMKKSFLVVLMFIFIFSFIALASSQTELNVYLDDKGNAQFYGTGNLSNIPPGVTSISGKIRGTTDSLTSKLDEMWVFSYNLTDAYIDVYLPSGAIVKEANGDLSVTNNQINVYSFENSYIKYTIKEQNPFNFYPILALIIILIVLAAGYLFYRYIKLNKKNEVSKKKINKEDKLKIISGVLNERENIILENLKKSGKTKMSFLRKSISMPKASFSRHIQELGKKGLIKRTGEGRNKFVELKK